MNNENATVTDELRSSVRSDEHGVRAAREAVKEQAGTVGEDVRELASLVRDEVRAELARVQAQGKETVESARRRVKDAESSLADAVREHPVRSMAYAAGIGLVLGMIARR